MKSAVGGSGASSSSRAAGSAASLSTRPTRSSAGSAAIPASGERLAVAAAALGGGEHRRAVAEEGDPAVAGREQVLDGGPRAAGVVGHDRVGVDEARRAVDEHERPSRPRARAGGSSGRRCRAR